MSQRSTNKQSHTEVDTIEEPTEPFDWFKYANHVPGHDERETIVGNFTGRGIDTIYIECRPVNRDEEGCAIYAVSNNRKIPDVELSGCLHDTPLLVFEGDVDGDGRDEWGYLPTWDSSTWRTYRIFNYNPKKRQWRHLYCYDEKEDDVNLLSTNGYMRQSGLEIVEKGPKPGLIKINYLANMIDGIIKDTIVKPTYTPITKFNN